MRTPEIAGLYEVHLTVSDLDRSIAFYRDKLGLPVARVFPERQAAFLWIGPGRNAMLGLWGSGYGPQRMILHTAFRLDSPQQVVEAAAALQSCGITPLDFVGAPAGEPVVLAWMPAVSIYFRDPDGHMLEYICMLPDDPRPELGVVNWSQWRNRSTAG